MEQQSPRQWINIDITVIPMDVLGGDFGAVMMDRRLTILSLI